MRAAFCLAFALALSACSSIEPIPITDGDRCFRCGRPIMDAKLATEIIDLSNRAFKFRTVRCLTQYLACDEGDVRAIFVTDHPSGQLIEAGSASYVLTVIDDNTLAEDYLAFGSLEVASAFATAEHLEPPIAWGGVAEEAGVKTASN